MKRMLFFMLVVFCLTFTYANVADAWNSSGLTGKDVISIAIDPNNNQIIYAGTFADGVYKSTDGGASWLPINSGLRDSYSVTIESLVIDPTNSQTVYAGTGQGVFKSTNGGASWLWTWTISWSNVTGIKSMVLDPANSQIVYVGTGQGVHKSTNGCINWSAANSGISNTTISSLVIDPTNGQTLYASTWTTGILKSVDGGASWSTINNGLSETTILFLAIDPTNRQTIYAAGNNGKLFKTTNGGSSWSTSIYGSVSGIGVLVRTIAIDPSNSQTLYAGDWSSGVMKSTDGGNSWFWDNVGLSIREIRTIVIDKTAEPIVLSGTSSGISKALPPPSPPTITGFSLPTSAASLTVAIKSFVATDNVAITGYMVTESAFQPSPADTYWSSTPPTTYSFQSEGTKTLYAWTKDAAGNISAPVSAITTITIVTTSGIWQSIGIEGQEILSVAIDPANSQTIYAGTRSAGIFKSSNGGVSWVGINVGMLDSYSGAAAQSLVIDPTDSQTIYAGTSQGIFKSTNGGASWFWTYSVNFSWISNVQCLVIDPTNTQILYAGRNSYGMAKSTNGGVTWTDLNNGITDSYPTIQSIAIDQTNGQTLYAATLSGVFKSTNRGASWTSANNGIGSTMILSIAIDPANTQTLYAGANYGILYKSTNGGSSWSTVNTGLSNTVASLAVDPTNSQTVYAGTFSAGVYLSTNGGASWAATNNGITSTSVNSIAIKGQTVYAGTSGGIFKSISTTPPKIIEFILPGIATTTTVQVYSLAATDNVAVFGYLLTEANSVPSPADPGWSIAAPTSYVFSNISVGITTQKTLYAWAKDAAGNISQYVAASTNITIPDVTPPTITAFTIPSSTPLTVPVTTFTVTDNVAVIGFCITEASSSTSCSWSATAPMNYSFTTAGAKTLYAWAKDAVGNISLPVSANVNVTSKPGDSNADGTVSIAEVQSAINMFLGLKAAEGYVDQDGAGGVSIAEIQKVINSFLGITSNTPPAASAGTAQSVAVGALVTLNGSGSSDVNGDLLSYSWSITSKPVGSSAALSSEVVVNPTFTADVEGAYVLNLIVNDGNINSTSATVTITATIGLNVIVFENEYNDERTYATVFNVGEKIQGGLWNLYDVDWLAVDVNTYGKLTINVEITNNSIGDFYVNLYSPDLTTMRAGPLGSGFPGLNFKYEAYTSTSDKYGRWYIKIVSNGSLNASPYTVTATVTPL